MTKFGVLLFISGPEIIVVLFVILLLFGSKKIPELARGLGKGIKEFKNATGDIQREIQDSVKDVNKVKDDIHSSLKK